VLCVYGSGFGTKPEDGFFRVVFLADPRELSDIYDLVADFTGDFLSRGGRPAQTPSGRTRVEG
jgi:aspartate/methionine/tyrosine aminotransferase